MQYRKLVDGSEELSVLGYGCMRFPTRNGRIDEEKAEMQMLYAFQNGVNYYDTAYPYHGGKSEVMLGKFINRHNLRDKIYIADKLPSFLVNKPEQIQKYFDTQLERLNTDYIDYYLMHMLDSLQSWERLKRFGILDFIKEKKKSGQIRHIGFSFHGRPEEFIKILEDYDWEFCQIQFNYLDEYNQAGLAGLKKAYEKGIGVVIMEPLRGGNLAAKAPDKVKEKFAEYKENRSPAYWALRWIWNHKEVGVVLSGMNVDEHIEENIKVANLTTPDCMSIEEIRIVDEVKEIYKSLMKVPCTGCNYCMPCPFGVDIPSTFSEYNSKYFFGGRMAQAQYIGRAVGMIGGNKSGADLCTECGKCEKHCPQNIQIRKELKNAHQDLDSRLMRFFVRIAMRFMGGRKKREEA
ncbi:aldo/keto reductase [Vallitalea okinawensis]|uniref:aldo/keto reductase n=1 Tax=Vallitalea okinawensis TaxID=2078660 RepID=UPI000CFAB0E5|nr:aldo/keto reductase [Vallitalea okinawensis]